MAGEAARVMVLVGADVSGAVAGLKSIDGQVRDTASSIDNNTRSIEGGFSQIGSVAGRVLTVGIGAAVAGTVALGAVLASSVKEAMDAQEGQAQLAAVLKSTAGAAGMTAESVNQIASSLATVTRFEDDAIVSSESMLLTFKNISSDVFPQATEAMLNMSTAMGQDLQSSAIQLGKALNDPAEGMSALRRVGVQFTDDQEKMIKAMVASGDIMGAQKVILGELESQFGGAARAAGETFAGQMDIMRNQIGEVKESIGSAMLPALSQLATLLGPVLITASQQFGDFLTNKLVPAFQSAVTWITTNWPQIEATVRTVFEAITAVVGPAIAVIEGVLSGSSGAIGEWGATWNIIKSLIDAVVPPIQGIIESVFGAISTFLAQHGDDIKAFLGDAWSQVAEIVGLAVQVIQTVVVPVFTAISGFLRQHSDDISTYLGGTWEIIKNIISGALDIITGVLKVALALLRGDWEGAWEAVKTTAENVWGHIQGIVEGGLTVIASLFGTNLEGLQAIFAEKLAAVTAVVTPFIEGLQGYFSGMWQAISGIFQAGLEATSGIVKAAGQIWQGDWTGAWETIQATASTVWASIQSSVEGSLRALAAVMGTDLEGLKRIFTEKFDAIKTYLRTINLSDIGRSIVDGLKQGIVEAWDDLVAKVNELIAGLSLGAKKILGIDSPSKVFFEIGENISEGLALGIGKSFVGIGADISRALASGIGRANATINVASSSLVNSAIGGMAPAFARAGSGYGGGGSWAGASPAPTRGPVYVGGDTYAMMISDETTAAMTAAMIGDRKRQRMASFMGG